MPAVALLHRLLPQHELARALSGQSILFAFGTGIFLTGNAVFFTQIVGLTPAQVGLGMTIAGVVTFVCAVPAGRLADRFNRRWVWAGSTVAMALLYLTYPWVHGMAGYTLVVVLIEVVGSMGGSAYNAYTLDVFDPAERVRWMAYMRAALNLGFTLGALVGGVALAANSETLVRALPIVTALVMLVNTVFILRLPDPQLPTAQRPVRAGPAAASAGDGAELIPRGALRNKGFLTVAVCNGMLTTNQVLLNLVIPLWLVSQTDAPRWVLAWLLGTNTVMAVLLQVRAARGVRDLESSLRASRRAAVCFVVSCAIIVGTHETVGWLTIALMWLGHVTVTGAELFESAGSWGYESELTDPSRRGEYQGAAQLGHTVGSVWAPAAYTFCAMQWAPWGWALIAAVPVAAVLVLPRAARSALAYVRPGDVSHNIGLE